MGWSSSTSPPQGLGPLQYYSRYAIVGNGEKNRIWTDRWLVMVLRHHFGWITGSGKIPFQQPFQRSSLTPEIQISVKSVMQCGLRNTLHPCLSRAASAEFAEAATELGHVQLNTCFEDDSHNM